MADPSGREGDGQEGGGGTLAAVPLGKDGLPLLSHEGVEEEEESDEDDLWDVDGDMTAEQVAAALAEEKRRKKVHCDDTQLQMVFSVILTQRQRFNRVRRMTPPRPRG